MSQDVPCPVCGKILDRKDPDEYNAHMATHEGEDRRGPHLGDGRRNAERRRGTDKTPGFLNRRRRERRQGERRG